MLQDAACITKKILSSYYQLVIVLYSNKLSYFFGGFCGQLLSFAYVDAGTESLCKESHGWNILL